MLCSLFCHCPTERNHMARILFLLTMFLVEQKQRRILGIACAQSPLLSRQSLAVGSGTLVVPEKGTWVYGSRALYLRVGLAPLQAIGGGHSFWHLKKKSLRCLKFTARKAKLGCYWELPPWRISHFYLSRNSSLFLHVSLLSENP